MYSFLTLQDREVSDGYVVEDTTDIVERSGYRTIESQVRELIGAGEKLIDWRAAMWPEDAPPVPVFMDSVSAAERSRDVLSRFSARQEERRLAEAEARAALANAAKTLAEADAAELAEFRRLRDGGGVTPPPGKRSAAVDK